MRKPRRVKRFRKIFYSEKVDYFRGNRPLHRNLSGVGGRLFFSRVQKEESSKERDKIISQYSIEENSKGIISAHDVTKPLPLKKQEYQEEGKHKRKRRSLKDIETLPVSPTETAESKKKGIFLSIENEEDKIIDSIMSEDLMSAFKKTLSRKRKRKISEHRLFQLKPRALKLKENVRLFDNGRSNNEIAELTNIYYQTISRVMQDIQTKLDAFQNDNKIAK